MQKSGPRTMNAHPSPPGIGGWMSRSQLVRNWASIRKEVDRYKWIESERAGYDIGWDRAWTEWMIKWGPEASNHE